MPKSRRTAKRARKRTTKTRRQRDPAKLESQIVEVTMRKRVQTVNCTAGTTHVVGAHEEMRGLLALATFTDGSSMEVGRLWSSLRPGLEVEIGVRIAPPLPAKPAEPNEDPYDDDKPDPDCLGNDCYCHD